ncbi:MAG: ester cyclase [Acidobacteria bacterium]|nr:ester cyclase [Acidobacteriota bacterium]
MSTPNLVQEFYEHIWNAGDLGAVPALLSKSFTFRGSLGTATSGHEAFGAYVHDIRTALAHYRCDILECVSEGDRAFAKMRFSGRHVSSFRGYAPTGKPVQWLGAALFRFDGRLITDLWVLGDLAALDAALQANQAA